MKRVISLFVMDFCTVMDMLIQLCLPETRVSNVLKLAQNMPFGWHMAFRRTNDRISMSFFFPGQRARVKDHCMRCETVMSVVCSSE
jgi:hypothetical protein